MLGKVLSELGVIHKSGLGCSPEPSLTNLGFSGLTGYGLDYDAPDDTSTHGG